jgi:hydroxypyruvate reductase
MAAHLRLRGDTLVAGRRRLALRSQPVWVLGAGKAAGPMAAAVEAVLGPERIAGGAVVSHDATAGPLSQRVSVLQGSHPVPGQDSIAATQRLLDLAEGIPRGAVVLWLLSGGASALLAAPAGELSLLDKQETTRVLLRSGATIDEMNTVRKHLSAVKGGQFARRLAGRRVVTLAISDIISGRLDMIGSGPTLPDPTTYDQALAIIGHYGVQRAVPVEVLDHLQQGAAGDLPETPKPGDPCFRSGSFTLLASPGTAAQAAAAAARKAGVRNVEVLTDQLAGEARDAAKFLGQVLRYRAAAARGPQVLVAAGETTVTVRGAGQGGRNQELAAALIGEVAGSPGLAVACIATDGQDFVPGAGGALIDGDTQARAAIAGIDIAALLADNDTHRLHQALGTLVEADATGTNVCDLVIAVLGVE